MATSFDREELTSQAEQVGIAEVLLKPVNASTLFNTALWLLRGEDRRKLADNENLTSVFSLLHTIQGAHVLLVEDNALNQEVATELLKEARLITDVAENGEVAVQMVQENQYDIVLMDMQMPVMDGIEATLAIRELGGEFAELPIVAMTANAMLSDRNTCLAAGMNDHIGKPIEPEELWNKLLRWIKPRASANGQSLSAGPQQHEPDPNFVKVQAIEGLNINAGLNHCLGKQGLYLSLLCKFAETQKQFSQQLDHALATEQMKVAERLTHTLKGLAGNLGAEQLKKDAATIEGILHAHQIPLAMQLQPFLQSLSTNLQNLVSQIEENLQQPEQTEPEPPVQIDRVALENFIFQIAQLLEENNSEAVDKIEANKALLKIAFAEQFQPFYAAVHNFDLELAADILKQCSAKLQIGLIVKKN